MDTVRLDGVLTPVDALPAPIPAGATIALPAGSPGSVELVAGDRLMLEIEGDVVVELPPTAPRWPRGTTRGALRGEGVLRIATGPGFAGQRLFMQGEGAEWELRGTTISAEAGGGRLCLCVYEGEIAACATGQEMSPVGHGHSVVFERGKGGGEVVEIMPSEAERLSALRTRADRRFATAG